MAIYTCHSSVELLAEMHLTSQQYRSARGQIWSGNPLPVEKFVVKTLNIRVIGTEECSCGHPKYIWGTPDEK